MFTLTQVLASMAWAAMPWDSPRSVIGANDLVPIGKVQNIEWYAHARAVGRVDSGGAGYCSVFRVAPDLFMTNQHCVSFKSCSEMIFHFGYEPEIAASDRALFQCEELLFESLRYDSAIYRARLKQGKDLYPSARLFDGHLSDGQSVLFASYPGTFSKQTDYSDGCRIEESVPQFIYDRMTLSHGCDSMSGSSGAPVFDRVTGNVVAIHWGGKGEYPWNHAILMRDVLETLRSHNPAVYDTLTIVH